MTTMTATNARKNFFEVVNGATLNHEIYHIHHRKGDVVLMSEEEYKSLTETIELLSSPGFKEKLATAKKEVANGDTVNFEEVFGEPL